MTASAGFWWLTQRNSRRDTFICVRFRLISRIIFFARITFSPTLCGERSLHANPTQAGADVRRVTGRRVSANPVQPGLRPGGPGLAWAILSKHAPGPGWVLWSTSLAWDPVKAWLRTSLVNLSKVLIIVDRNSPCRSPLLLSFCYLYTEA